jgi:DNA-binding beta-propeller fold protein YncE
MIKQRICKSILLFVGLVLVSLGNVTFADEPRTLYVINGLGRTLSKLNLETEVIVNDFLTIGQWPNQILSFNGMLYVVNSGTNDIMIIDPRDDGQEPVIISLAQGSNPYYMAFVGANKAYVTNLSLKTKLSSPTPVDILITALRRSPS